MKTPPPHTFVALTALSVPIPGSSNGTYLQGRHLVGVGIVTARQQDRRWHFSRASLATGAGEPEATLLAALTRHLAEHGTLIGWQVDRQMMPTLLEAAQTAPPTVARDFLATLRQLTRGGVVDVALDHGGAAAGTLAAAAEEQAIYSPHWNADAVLASWGVGQLDTLRRDLADEAVALWRLFASGAPRTQHLAEEAITDAPSWPDLLEQTRRAWPAADWEQRMRKP